MKSLRIFAATVAVCFALSGCATAAGPVIAPITVNANDLQGITVMLDVGQVLNINTGDLAADSYTATVADSSVAEFVQGGKSGSATFNPGFTGLAAGTTDVTLQNKDGGIQALEFVIQVNG